MGSSDPVANQRGGGADFPSGPKVLGGGAPSCSVVAIYGSWQSNQRWASNRGCSLYQSSSEIKNEQFSQDTVAIGYLRKARSHARGGVSQRFPSIRPPGSGLQLAHH